MAALARIALSVLAVGCGRFGFDRSAPVEDADSPVVDSPVDAPLGAFGPPVMISVSTAALEDDPTLTADLLELYFESDRAGGLGGSDLWFTTRSAVGGAWATPQPVGIVNTSSNEEHAGLSPDGLTLFFASDRTGGLGSFDIYFSTRADRAPGTPWSAPQLAANLNDAANNEAPQIDASGLVMVMAIGPNGDEDLFISTRASSAAPWNIPTPISELNMAGVSDTAPTLSASGLEIYFSSGRAGTNDLYVATRPSLTMPFDAPVAIAELSTSSAETDPWISPDRRTIVFVSDVNGQRDLFEATR